MDELLVRHEDPGIKYGYAHISQLTAAEPVLRAIGEVKANYGEKPGLEAVYGTDVISLRRGLCLPAATIASLNRIYGYRKFNEASIAEMYKSLLPLHGAPAVDPVSKQAYPQGWKVVTPEGDMYYHAITKWVSGITSGEADAIPILNYELERVLPIIGSTNSAMALSLDNTFVLDWVEESERELGRKFVTRNENDQVLFNGGELGQKPFQNGRHVVSVMDTSSNYDRVLVSDSFALPGMTTRQTMRWWPVETVAKYLNYSTRVPRRAIVFTKNGQIHPDFNNAVLSHRVPTSVPTT